MTKDLYDKLMVFGNDQEPFLTHNFMRTTDLDDGTATVTLPMHTESLNRWGGAHGGILFSLCDVAMGMAIMTLRQEMVVTVNATIDYLSTAAAGSTLTTVGKVDRLGGKLAFCSAEMTDETGKVIVEGVNMVTRHQKARNAMQPGGIVKKEAAIDASNVMLICPKCGKPPRVSHKVNVAVDANGKKNRTMVRVCKKCGADID